VAPVLYEETSHGTIPTNQDDGNASSASTSSPLNAPLYSPYLYPGYKVPRVEDGVTEASPSGRYSHGSANFLNVASTSKQNYNIRGNSWVAFDQAIYTEPVQASIMTPSSVFTTTANDHAQVSRSESVKLRLLRYPSFNSDIDDMFNDDEVVSAPQSSPPNVTSAVEIAPTEAAVSQVGAFEAIVSQVVTQPIEDLFQDTEEVAAPPNSDAMPANAQVQTAEADLIPADDAIAPANPEVQPQADIEPSFYERYKESFKRVIAAVCRSFRKLFKCTKKLSEAAFNCVTCGVRTKV
jgi:hypothetical protein